MGNAEYMGHPKGTIYRHKNTSLIRTP